MPGLAAFEARGRSWGWRSMGRSAGSSCSAPCRPLIYYGRLLLVGVGDRMALDCRRELAAGRVAGGPDRSARLAVRTWSNNRPSRRPAGPRCSRSWRSRCRRGHSVPRLLRPACRRRSTQPRSRSHQTASPLESVAVGTARGPGEPRPDRDWRVNRRSLSARVAGLSDRLLLGRETQRSMSRS